MTAEEVEAFARPTSRAAFLFKTLAFQGLPQDKVDKVKEDRIQCNLMIFECERMIQVDRQILVSRYSYRSVSCNSYSTDNGKANFDMHSAEFRRSKKVETFISWEGCRPPDPPLSRPTGLQDSLACLLAC